MKNTMDGISGVPGPPTWRRAHYYRGGVIIAITYYSTIIHSRPSKRGKDTEGGVWRNSDTGFQVLPFGAEERVGRVTQNT